MGYWTEVRNDFFEGVGEINQALEGDVLATISIDAWKTADEWEEGKVIASVMLSLHGDILVDYRDNLARTDAAAQWAIIEAKDQLKEYFQEKQQEDLSQSPRQVSCLCEEFENDDVVRQFRILAVSSDKNALRKLMEAKIAADEDGFIAENGVDTHEQDHFLTSFDEGFLEYYISDENVLSREELEQMVNSEIVAKHISEILKGDKVFFEDCVYTASSDAYMTKTDNGREWNFEVEGNGSERYLYASYFEGGMVVVAHNHLGKSKVPLSEQIQSAAHKAAPVKENVPSQVPER